MIWGSDFAHATGDWPNSQEIINKTFAGVAPAERRKMIGGNAIEFFHLNATADLDVHGRAMREPEAVKRGNLPAANATV
jgi:hypothetical protein